MNHHDDCTSHCFEMMGDRIIEAQAILRDLASMAIQHGLDDEVEPYLIDAGKALNAVDAAVYRARDNER